jgi:RNA polymerase sigma factor (sigma-70 family)
MARGTADAVRRHIRKLAGRHDDARATDRELLGRFSAQRDEAAFEALVRRHGAMVLAAGRRVLGNAHDAEDVCQAAFLLLAKKAASQRWQPSVASWLHKTAHLLALRARTAANRRARREASAAARPPANPLAEVSGQELLAALDEELLALPEALRAPLVLCYLQGATRDEAAQRLGCPLTTLKNRLERGREQLRAALVRRGVGLSAVLLGTLLTQQTAGAAATIALALGTARAALALAAGRSVDGAISPQVSQLLKGGAGTMCWNRLAAALALLLVGGLLSTAGALAYSAGDDKPAGPPPKDAPQDKNAERPAAAPARAQGTTLRYKFKEGDSFTYVVEKKTEVQSNTLGIERLAMTKQTTEAWDVTWKVTAVDADGNAQVTLTVDRVRHVSDNGFPAGKMEFDSREHKNPVGPAVLVRALSPVLKSQVGAEFKCTVSPRGEVSDFKVPKKVADAVKSTQGVRELYSTEEFKQRLACQGGIVLPRGPLSKEAGWNERADTVLVGGHAKLTVDTRATYKGEAERGAKKLAEIALKPTASTLEANPRSGLGPFTLKGDEGKGSLLFDNDSGRLVETEVVQNIDMESSPPGQTEKVIYKVKLSLSTKLVPPK